MRGGPSWGHRAHRRPSGARWRQADAGGKTADACQRRWQVTVPALMTMSMTAHGELWRMSGGCPNGQTRSSGRGARPPGAHPGGRPSAGWRPLASSARPARTGAPECGRSGGDARGCGWPAAAALVAVGVAPRRSPDRGRRVARQELERASHGSAALRGGQPGQVHGQRIAGADWRLDGDRSRVGGQLEVAHGVVRGGAHAWGGLP